MIAGRSSRAHYTETSLPALRLAILKLTFTVILFRQHGS